MRFRFLLLPGIALLVGCPVKNSDPPVAGTTSATPATTPSPPSAPPGDPPVTTPVAGQIQGKPFTPDQVIFEGKSLSFRKGKDFFPEAEIKFDMPEGSLGNLKGREWTFAGRKPENPTVFVAKTEGKDVPKTEFVWPEDYTMTIKITDQTKKEVKGTIDLRVTKPANTHLAGTFTATIKKTFEDPLDADDAPYIQGKIVFVGPWKQEKLAIGFVGKGADGKPYSNMAGVTLSAEFTGGGATSMSFAPQLTSLTNTKAGPGYRHTQADSGRVRGVCAPRRGTRGLEASHGEGRRPAHCGLDH